MNRKVKVREGEREQHLPKLTRQEQELFLNTREVLMRIACVREDGSPLVTPIWFISWGDSIWFTPRELSEWFGCSRRDPRVSLCIDEEAHHYRKILVDGRVELVHNICDDDLWRDLYRDIASLYIREDAAEAYVHNTIEQRRGLYRLFLSEVSVKSWRMPLRGERAEGIWYDRYYGEGTRYKWH